MRSRHWRWIAPISAGLLLAAAHGALAATGKVGVAAAVNPQAVGMPPGEGDRALFIGAKVVHDERIRTGENGRTQVVFLDGSALTVGPNAEMVIDEFVYDPEAKAGTLALTAAKGAFRFVGGRISKNKAVQIKTPTAIIGIRGGIAMFEVGERTTATFLYGEEMRVTAGNVTKSVTTPGFAVAVEPGGAAPSDPKPAPPQSLKQAVVGLEAGPRSDPGLPDPPADQDVAKSQIGNLGSKRTPVELENSEPPGGQGQKAAKKRNDNGPDRKGGGNKAQPGQNFGPQQGFRPFTPVNRLNNNIVQANQQTQTQFASEQAAASPFSGRLKIAADAQALSGTLDTTANRNIAFVGGKATLDYFLTDANGGNLKLPLGAPGSVTNFFQGGGTSEFGAVSGSSYFSQDGGFVTFDLRFLDQGGARATAFAGLPVKASDLPTTGHTDFALTSDFVLRSNVAFLTEALGGNIAPLSGTVGHEQGAIVWDTSGSSNAQRAVGFLQLYVNGTGTNQRSVVGLVTGEVLIGSNGRAYIAGQSRGSSRLADGTGYFFEGGVTSTPGGDGNHFYGANGSLNFGLQSAVDQGGGNITASATRASNVTNTSSYFANVYASSTQDTPDTGVRATETLRGFAAGAGQAFGSAGNFNGITTLTTTSSDPSKVFTQTDASTNKINSSISVSNSANVVDFVLPFGDIGASSGRSIYIDSTGFGAVEGATLATVNGTAVSEQRSYFFSDDVIDNIGLLPGGVAFCQCQALRWGFWGTDLKLDGGQRRRVHLGTWVGGSIPSAAAIAGQTGSATYNGHVVGSVVTGTGAAAQSYLAVGGLSVNYNFATHTGTVSVNNFDGVGYNGSIGRIGAGQEHLLYGSITSSSGPTRTGTLNGAFFNSNGAANGAMGGDVDITQSGGGYGAVGTFAAHK